MGQVKDINNFKAIKNGSKASKGYKIIPFKIVFDVNFDIRLDLCLISKLTSNTSLKGILL